MWLMLAMRHNQYNFVKKLRSAFHVACPHEANLSVKWGFHFMIPPALKLLVFSNQNHRRRKVGAVFLKENNFFNFLN